jgi:GNAT superfamily N-acetyltransferase
MDATIRDATHEDLPALVELLKELSAIEDDFTPDHIRQQKGLALMLDGCRKHRCVKVAEVDGIIVGMCTAQWLISTVEGGAVALVEDMVVAAARRGQGIGGQLMAGIERWALNHNMTRAQLLADRSNSSALEFYDRIGWRPTQLVCLRRNWK